MSGTAVRAILFDVGDTLVRLQPMERNLAPRMAAVMQAAQVPCDQPNEVCESLLGNIRREILAGFESGRLEEHMLPAMVQALLSAAGLELHQSVADDLAAVLHEADIARIQPWPGVVEQLLGLRADGYRLAAVSNTTTRSALLHAFFERHGLKDCFQGWVFSIDLGVRKPQERMYHEALAAISASANEALFVGDRVREDVVGPRAAGIAHAILTHEHRQEDPRDSAPCAVIANLSELPGLLPSLR